MKQPENKNKKAQIVIEFLLLIGMAFFIIIVLLISLMSVSEGNHKTKTYNDLNDLGMSLQEEFLLAAELEDGYTRKINLPATVNGVQYNATLGSLANDTRSYLQIDYESTQLYYELPKIYGTLTMGDNIIRKNDGVLRLN
ncbi:MAG TPA: hypothetical protein VEC16_02000 [Alphaproteobacteria bacterium]|nr:hypothetical protein [Alphaproteobacteria bacterium]